MQPDNRVDIDIELNHDEWYQLMCIAHEQDITLNQMVAQVLTAALAQHEQLDTLEQDNAHDTA